MKPVADRDLLYVLRILKENKSRCSSLQGIAEVRIEAEKARACERGVSRQTIHRQLKFAARVDKQGNAAALDSRLHEIAWGKSNEQG